MVVIFPFEVAIYEKAKTPVSYFGYPIVNHVLLKSKPSSREEFKLTETATVIGLLPGGRKNELIKLMPTLTKGAKKILARYPKTQFLLPIAKSLNINDFKPYFDEEIPITLIEHQNYRAMAVCDLLIGAAGTVTLEAAIVGVPMIIIYKINSLTYWLAKKLIHVQFIGLSNLLANKKNYSGINSRSCKPRKYH